MTLFRVEWNESTKWFSVGMHIHETTYHCIVNLFCLQNHVPSTYDLVHHVRYISLSIGMKFERKSK